MKTRFIIVMGVAGSGKTTVGQALAKRLGWDFFDADGFHSLENIAKMANGVPLEDSDRDLWLSSLHALLSASLRKQRPAVLACSALKAGYRQKLLEGNTDVLVVYLKGSYDLIWARLAARADHFMKPHMLQSQFEALEEPTDVLTIDIALPPEDIVNSIIERL